MASSSSQANDKMINDLAVGQLWTKASDQALMALLNTYDAFAFDLDGTIWKGNTLIPGAKEVLDLLRKLGYALFFVTNNSTKSRASVMKKMIGLGLIVKEGEVLGSSHAAAVFLKSHNIKKAYVVGEAGLVEELDAAGIQAVGGPADNGLSFDWKAENPEVTLDPGVTAVVVGLDRDVNYLKIQTAMAYLVTQKAVFVATNQDSRGNLASTQEWAGAGTMVGAVAACSEMEPFVVGKPNPLLMDIACKAAGISRNKLCVVGDRLDTDIAWAHNNGAGALLVLTGCTTEQQLQVPGVVTKPLMYIDSVADLLSIKALSPTRTAALAEHLAHAAHACLPSIRTAALAPSAEQLGHATHASHAVHAHYLLVKDTDLCSISKAPG
eukprot:CAMPEP_0119104396 /NCGR_PEP_ID=MMETSP1180-20130426/2619_1 /TAXON_ID=3052 ORGANISM="Chlamydomonas cf sp, Strain CCMP681" /NCGR_SAMPLE_ID=MMETSP1180 /ASSEMBLY_ACC=CAM_ASM_000741 /LENGTH=380 /DNA_ID=CAMNT_0007089139 /DNA_START=14 /DNA_END=1157 /DNA_ORIENTATION=-